MRFNLSIEARENGIETIHILVFGIASAQVRFVGPMVIERAGILLMAFTIFVTYIPATRITAIEFNVRIFRHDFLLPSV